MARIKHSGPVRLPLSQRVTFQVDPPECDRDVLCPQCCSDRTTGETECPLCGDMLGFLAALVFDPVVRSPVHSDCYERERLAPDE